MISPLWVLAFFPPPFSFAIPFSTLLFWLSGKGEDKELPLAWTHDVSVTALLAVSSFLPQMDIIFEVWNTLLDK